MIHFDALTRYTIKEKDKIFGEIHVNEKRFPLGAFTRPILRKTQSVSLIYKSDIPYEQLDQHIISSLKDYYNKINEVHDFEEKKRRITVYQRLYNLWINLNAEKNKGNHEAKDAYYHDLKYELYVLGYVFEQK